MAHALAKATGRLVARALPALAAVAVVGVGLGPLTGTYRIATVLSASMAPGMPAGSVAVLAPVSPAALRVGDVVTFQAPLPAHPVITHRVVGISEPGPHPVLRTQGDANASPDPWSARISSGPAWRRVAVVPGAGGVIRWLRTAPVHRATVQLAPLLLLAVMLAGIWGPGPVGRPQLRLARLSLARPRLARSTQRAMVVVAGSALALGFNAVDARAGFTKTPTASAVRSTLTLATPTLTCDGLGVTTVVLHPADATDAVTDPYGTGGALRISGYSVERTGAGDSNYSPIGSVAVGAAYTDAPGGLGVYKYRVKATKGTFWTSPVSASVTATVVLAVVTCGP